MRRREGMRSSEGVGTSKSLGNENGLNQRAVCTSMSLACRAHFKSQESRHIAPLVASFLFQKEDVSIRLLEETFAIRSPTRTGQGPNVSALGKEQRCDSNGYRDKIALSWSICIIKSFLDGPRLEWERSEMIDERAIKNDNNKTLEYD